MKKAFFVFLLLILPCLVAEQAWSCRCVNGVPYRCDAYGNCVVDYDTCGYICDEEDGAGTGIDTGIDTGTDVDTDGPDTGTGGTDTGGTDIDTGGTGGPRTDVDKQFLLDKYDIWVQGEEVGTQPPQTAGEVVEQKTNCSMLLGIYLNYIKPENLSSKRRDAIIEKQVAAEFGKTISGPLPHQPTYFEALSALAKLQSDCPKLLHDHMFIDEQLRFWRQEQNPQREVPLPEASDEEKFAQLQEERKRAGITVEDIDEREARGEENHLPVEQRTPVYTTEQQERLQQIEDRLEANGEFFEDLHKTGKELYDAKRYYQECRYNLDLKARNAGEQPPETSSEGTGRISMPTSYTRTEDIQRVMDTVFNEGGDPAEEYEKAQEAFKEAKDRLDEAREKHEVNRLRLSEMEKWQSELYEERFKIEAQGQEAAKQEAIKHLEAAKEDGASDGKVTADEDIGSYDQETAKAGGEANIEVDAEIQFDALGGPSVPEPSGSTGAEPPEKQETPLETLNKDIAFYQQKLRETRAHKARAAVERAKGDKNFDEQKRNFNTNALLDLDGTCEKYKKAMDDMCRLRDNLFAWKEEETRVANKLSQLQEQRAKIAEQGGSGNND